MNFSKNLKDKFEKIPKQPHESATNNFKNLNQNLEESYKRLLEKASFEKDLSTNRITCY